MEVKARRSYGLQCHGRSFGRESSLVEIHKLFGCHDWLLDHKAAFISHLRECWKDLFNARFEVLLYDLTSTYLDLLRSNTSGEDPAKLWEFYAQLTQVEEAFKTIKGDLAIRPIYHQREDREEADIFVAFLAWCVQVTLSRRLRDLAPGFDRARRA